MNFKKGVVYIFIANAINLLMGLFAGFILPKFLSVETYSDIKLFQLYVTYLGILHLGFSDGMYLRHGGKIVDTINKKEINAEFRTFKVFQLVVSIIAIAIAAIIQNKILLFCALAIIPINAGNYLRSLYQAIGEFKKYSRFTNINTLLIFVINVILLFIIKSDNPMVYVMAYVVAYFVYWIFLEIENRKIFGKESGRPNRKYLVSDIKTGFFLMTGNFCNVIFTSIDRLFVERLMGKIEFAMYSFAVGIENLASVFVNPISTVLYNYFCNNRGVGQVRKMKRIVLLFGSGVLLCAYPAKFVVRHWLTNYESAIGIIFILFAAQFASIIVRCIHINLYKSYKKQNRYFVIMIMMVILSVALDAIFYSIFGTMESIAIATLVTNIIWFIVGELDLRKFSFSIKDYLFFIIIMAVFLATVTIENAILGMAAYALVLFVTAILLLPGSVKFLMINVEKLKNKILKKGGIN